jgi:hypothetical protein
MRPTAARPARRSAECLVAWLREQTAYDRRDQLERAIRKGLADWQKENA